MNSDATVLVVPWNAREVRGKKKKEKRSTEFNGKRWIQTGTITRYYAQNKAQKLRRI